jgi:hypothetical protein
MTNTTVANVASRMVTNPYGVGTEEFYVCKERLYESIRAVSRNQVRASERRGSWREESLGQPEL